MDKDNAVAYQQLEKQKLFDSLMAEQKKTKALEAEYKELEAELAAERQKAYDIVAKFQYGRPQVA